MFCNKCGNEVDSNSKFCTRCGNPINVQAATVNPLPSASNENTVVIKKEKPWKLLAVLTPVWIITIALVIVIVMKMTGSNSGREKDTADKKKADTSVTETVSTAKTETKTETEASLSSSEIPESVAEAAQEIIVPVDLIQDFLDGNCTAVFRTNYWDNDNNNLVNGSISYYELLEMQKSDGWGATCDVITRTSRFERNGRKYLYLQYEKDGVDDIYTFFITEEDGELIIGNVYESWSRNWADYGPGYYIVGGSGGAGDYSESYWYMYDDSSAGIIATVENGYTGWIGDVVSYGAASVFLSEQTIQYGYELDNGGEVIVSLASLPGQKILMYVDGDMSDAVYAFIESAQSDGVIIADATGTGSIEYAIEQLKNEYGMVGDCNWEVR